MRKFNNDAVNHPSHYTDGKIEVIDFIEDKGLGFCLGNAVKYIARAGKKDATKEIEDLQKAVWYIERRIVELEKESNCDIEDLPEFDDAKIISHTSPVKIALLGEKGNNKKGTLGESLEIANQCDRCSNIQRLREARAKCGTIDEIIPYEDEDEDADWKMYNDYYEEKENDNASETLGGWTDEDLMPKKPQEAEDFTKNEPIENNGQINATDKERDEFMEAYEKAQLIYGILHACDPSYTWEQFLEDCKQAKAELEAEQEEKDYKTPIM